MYLFLVEQKRYQSTIKDKYKNYDTNYNTKYTRIIFTKLCIYLLKFL